MGIFRAGEKRDQSHGVTGAICSYMTPPPRTLHDLIYGSRFHYFEYKLETNSFHLSKLIGNNLTLGGAPASGVMPVCHLSTHLYIANVQAVFNLSINCATFGVEAHGESPEVLLCIALYGLVSWVPTSRTGHKKSAMRAETLGLCSPRSRRARMHRRRVRVQVADHPSTPYLQSAYAGCLHIGPNPATPQLLLFICTICTSSPG